VTTGLATAVRSEKTHFKGCLAKARYPSGKGEVCKTFMRRFDPGPRLQTFWSFPSELNGLGEIIGSLSIVSDGLKSASIGADVGL
jgi:hypothetical protein